MKLFGFYISAHDWRHKYEVANARANRNAHNATQYEQAWNETRKELTKTVEQMEAARHTREREIKELKKALQFEKDVNAVTNSNREGERKKYDEEISDLKKRILQLKEQRSVLEAEIIECREKEGRRKDEEYKSLCHDYRVIIAKKEEKITALQDYIAEMEKQIEGLKHELTATTGKIPNRDQVLHDQQQRISELEEACDKLIDENTEYSTKNENLRLQISTQKELLVELQMELDTYKERHEHKKGLKMARQQRYRENKRNKAEIQQENKK